MGHLDARVPRIAAVQLGMLAAAGAMRRQVAEREVPSEGTPVYDLDGTVLFERVRLDDETYADLAVAPEFGTPLIAAAGGAWWQPEALVGQAAASLKKRTRGAEWDEARFVAYSFPKLAVQFLKGGEEVALIECFTGEPVPVESADPNFRRIPFRAEFVDKRKAGRRIRDFDKALELASVELRRLDRWSDLIRFEEDWLTPLIRRTSSRDLHFSGRNDDHEPCFELRGQETNVWCVGASVQMVLDFYRYEYTQDRLAEELGLGTRDAPNGLPYSRDSDVVVALENLSNKSLTAAMNTSPTFAEYRTEINNNRPLISFVPGHSRAVAGYTKTTSIISSLNFQGLLVFDPWPPNAGVITRWENYGATTYRRTFTAHVTLT